MIVQFDDGRELTAGDLQILLSMVSGDRAFESISVGAPQTGARFAMESAAGKVLASFTRRVFKRIRALLCGPGKSYTGKTQAIAAISFLAA